MSGGGGDQTNTQSIPQGNINQLGNQAAFGGDLNVIQQAQLLSQLTGQDFTFVPQTSILGPQNNGVLTDIPSGGGLIGQQSGLLGQGIQNASDVLSGLGGADVLTFQGLLNSDVSQQAANRATATARSNLARAQGQLLQQGRQRFGDVVAGQTQDQIGRLTTQAESQIPFAAEQARQSSAQQQLVSNLNSFGATIQPQLSAAFAGANRSTPVQSPVVGFPSQQVSGGGGGLGAMLAQGVGSGLGGAIGGPIGSSIGGHFGQQSV